MALARKVYSSNKVIKQKEANLMGKEYASIEGGLKCGKNGRAKIVSCCGDGHQSKGRVVLLPIMKNVDSESTAEDLMEQINKKLSKEA